jgi:hypothetical protein
MTDPTQEQGIARQHKAMNPQIYVMAGPMVWARPFFFLWVPTVSLALTRVGARVPRRTRRA